MKFHLNRFLRRVRIHGGEFDTSARAMYRVSAKGSLITYEKAFRTRADLRIVRRSTIERKQMSTKTTFKRVALVTVAALGLGVMSVAPSNAAVQADTLSLSSATASTTVGTAVTTKVTVSFIQETTSDSMTVGLTYQAAPAGINIDEVTFTNTETADATDLGTPVVDTTTANSRLAKVSTAAAASVRKTMTVTLTPSKAGTYVIKVTPAHLPSGTPVSAALTWTVTVAAKTVKSSSVFLKGAGTFPVTDTATADATVSVTGAADTAAKARIDVASIYGLVANDTVTAADAPAVVVTTDKGLVSKTSVYTDGAKSVTTAAAVDGDPSYWIFSNGDIGKATITITVGTAAAVTKTVTFTGAATTLVATLTTGQDTFVKVGGTSTTTITATDAAASAVSIPTGLTVTSSDTSVATVAISSGVVTVTGVKAGTSTIKVTDPATSAAATAVSFTATVAPVRPTAAPTITFDAASYEVGSLVTMTVSANMGDSATAQLFTSTGIVLSAAVVASGTAIPNNGQHAIVGGKATYKFYAPAVSGSLAYTATTGGAVDITTAATVAGTIAITNAAADAATTAAEAAEAAAQDATDAALDATTAAEAAGALAQEAVDLVTELSAEVTKLIAGVRASITYLTKLVMKLAAKK